MIFLFLKYLSPTWYYNISSELSRANSNFVDYNSLPQDKQQLLDLKGDYRTEEAKLCDAAYQIFQKGIFDADAKPLSIIPKKREKRQITLFKGKDMEIDHSVVVTNIVDNYRFTRRFYNPMHALQILLIRLFLFHNPIKELYGFFSTLKVKRINMYASNGFDQYKDEYANFESSLISSSPKVSIIIPTLNRYEYLKDVLSDLEKQDYPNFEVIVCDQSEPFNEDFYKGWNLDLQVFYQQEKALWLARCSSIRRATGEYIAMSEDDVRIERDWISQHLKCVDFFDSDISAGIFYPKGKTIPTSSSFFKYASQFATGNALFKKDLMYTSRMYDRQFEKQRAGDGEFGLRVYLCGYKSISNPLACCIDIKAATGGLRQLGSWDGFRPTKLLVPRPVPSIVYLCRKYFGNRTTRIMLLITVPTSLTPYKYKGNTKMQLLSFMSFAITFPIVFTQIAISWHRASIKLKEGDKIERL